MLVFVDSNVLVYARDASEPNKQTRARAWIDQLWKTRAGRISFQVLHEYYVTVTRKLDPGLSRREARDDIGDLRAWRPLPLDGPVLDHAWAVEDRFGLSFWDALIVAAAQLADCEHLLTEDLQHDQDLDGLVVVNPFAIGPEELG